MTESMRAIRFHDYGGPEVLKIDVVPRPAPKDDEILIRAQAWGVNPVDWKIREGHVRKRVNIPLPATPGGDIAGVVAEVGDQQAKRRKVPRRYVVVQRTVARGPGRQVVAFAAGSLGGRCEVRPGVVLDGIPTAGKHLAGTRHSFGVGLGDLSCGKHLPED